MTLSSFYTWRLSRARTTRSLHRLQNKRCVPFVEILEDRTVPSGYLGSNYLLTSQLNTLSDVSAANATPGSLNVGDVVFGYQQLGQCENSNGAVNFPQGSVWVVFSFQVSSIDSPGDGSTYVNFAPTPAINPLSLQSLVPNLFTQTGLASTAPLIALEVNSVPDGADVQPSIFANKTMVDAMATFNSLGGGTSPQLSTEFAFGQVAANNDFLTVYSGTSNLINGGAVTEAGGATVLYNSDGYTGFAPLPNQNPANGAFTSLTSQVTIAGMVYQQPGEAGAPSSTTGAQATDHATYGLEPLSVPISGGQIIGTEYGCDDFVNGTAPSIDALVYNANKGQIKSVSPGAFYYFWTFTVGSGTTTIEIKEESDPSFSSIPAFDNNTVQLFDANCNQIYTFSVGGDLVDGNVTIDATGLKAGTYMGSVKYQASALTGSVPGGDGTVKYTFTTYVDRGPVASAETMLVPKSSPLHASAEGSGAAPSGFLTQAELQQAFQVAINYWKAQGISPANLSILSSTKLGITNLPGSILGLAYVTNRIELDNNAAGFGWSFDSNMNGGMNLTDAVTHEVGHLLGFEHDQGPDVMAPVLAPGQDFVTFGNSAQPFSSSLTASSPTSSGASLTPATNSIAANTAPTTLVSTLPQVGASALWMPATTDLTSGQSVLGNDGAAAFSSLGTNSFAISTTDGFRRSRFDATNYGVAFQTDGRSPEEMARDMLFSNFEDRSHEITGNRRISDSVARGTAHPNETLTQRPDVTDSSIQTQKTPAVQEGMSTPLNELHEANGEHLGGWFENFLKSLNALPLLHADETVKNVALDSVFAGVSALVLTSSLVGNERQSRGPELVGNTRQRPTARN